MFSPFISMPTISIWNGNVRLCPLKIDFVLITISFWIDKNGHRRQKRQLSSKMAEDKEAQKNVRRIFGNGKQFIKMAEWEAENDSRQIESLESCVWFVMCTGFVCAFFSSSGQWICLLNAHIYMQIFSIIFFYFINFSSHYSYSLAILVDSQVSAAAAAKAVVSKRSVGKERKNESMRNAQSVSSSKRYSCGKVKRNSVNVWHEICIHHQERIRAKKKLWR